MGGGDDAAFTRLGDFIQPIYQRLPGGGRLDILSAGQRQEQDQLARYALNLRSFDWQDFYFNWKGELFFEWLRRSLTGEGATGGDDGLERRDGSLAPYDLVIADSRTGVTEMGGICGYQLADVIVMFCAANHQNVQGTLDMIRDFRSPAVERLRPDRPLKIVVVPARIEQRDVALMDDFFGHFDQAFGALAPPALKDANVSFRDLMIPYEPEFAFEERVVSDPELTARRRPIAASFERLANAITLLAPPEGPLGQAARLVRASPSAPRAAASAQYDTAKRFAGYDVFIDSNSPDQELTDRLAAAFKQRGLAVFYDRWDLQPGSDWRAVVEEALFHSKSLLFCLGQKGLTASRGWTLDRALTARERGQPLAIVPVLLPGADPAMLRGTALIGLLAQQALDFREGLGEPEIELAARTIEGARREAPQVKVQARRPFAGHRPYGEQEADLYFGRDAAVGELERRLCSGAKLVALVGPSGAGKTSLLCAGLLPRLQAGNAAGQRWWIQRLTPASTDRLAVEAGLRAAHERQERALVVIDDWDLLFDGPSTKEFPAYARWVEQLAQGLSDDQALLLVIRADQFGATLAAMPLLAGSIVAARFDLVAMSTADLARIIEGPAERVGVAFEPGLAERVVAELQSEPQALPLLQQLLTKLWDERKGGWLTNAAYDRMGGLRRAGGRGLRLPRRARA